MANPTKTTLRREYTDKRNKIEAALRLRDSGFIRHRLLQLPAWQEADTILTYVSFSPEVDTHKIIEEALRLGKRVVVPCVDPKGIETALSELRSRGDLAPGPLRGILEPAEAFRIPVDPSEIELALVPGVAFDRKGGRLGLGGGYYDRLMPKMKNAFRLGLAFSVQLHVGTLPLESHDVPIDVILTEKELIEISSVDARRSPRGGAS
jgi:5-formyltetrahydrofolate cyclo-ligase